MVPCIENNGENMLISWTNSLKYAFYLVHFPIMWNPGDTGSMQVGFVCVPVVVLIAKIHPLFGCLLADDDLFPKLAYELVVCFTASRTSGA